MRIAPIVFVALVAASSACPGESTSILPNQDFEAAEVGWSLWPGGSQSEVADSVASEPEIADSAAEEPEVADSAAEGH